LKHIKPIKTRRSKALREQSRDDGKISTGVEILVSEKDQQKLEARHEDLNKVKEDLEL